MIQEKKMLLNFKTKIHFTGLLILTLFFCTSSFAGNHFISTPYFRISLDQAMKKFEDSSQSIKGQSAHRYGYSAQYQDIQASLGIVVVSSLPGNEINNPDRSQKQFIAGTVNGLFRKNNLPPADIYAVYDNVKSIHVNNREFKTYTVIDEENSNLIIYTTINNRKLYGFYITVVSDTAKNSKKIKTISKSLVNAVMQTQFVSP